MMSSSTESSWQQLQLPNIAGLTLNETGSIQVVLAVLLRHPCIMQDQQLVAKLLQTSRDVRAQVAQWGLRQLQVILQPRNLQEFECFTQWLQKHGSLVCGIAADLTRKHSLHCMGSCSSSCSKERAWAAAAVSTLTVAFQQAAAAGALQLQSLAVSGSTADASLLLQLSARHLTRLHVEVDFFSRGSIWAVAALAGLQELHLINTSPPGTAAYMRNLQARRPPACLHPLQHLQQLTQLQLGPLEPEQLLCLQPLLPQLQQLHITADVCGDPERLMVLARWLQQHANDVTSLQLDDTGGVLKALEGKAALRGFVSALPAAAARAPAQRAAQAAVAAAAAGASTRSAAVAAAAAAAGASTRSAAVAAAAAAAAGRPGLQLQSLSLGLALPDRAADGTLPAAQSGGLVAPLLRGLPVSSLTHLHCEFNWGNTAHVRALKRLTALRSCALMAPSYCVAYMDHAAARQLGRRLGHLSPLQQLTRLMLAEVSRAQLQQLQLPQLQLLEVQVFDLVPVPCTVPGRQQLDLSRLPAVRQLKITDATPLLGADQLPPNLQELVWRRPSSPAGSRVYGSDCGFILKPLLALSCLEVLQLHTQGPAAAAAGLRQLSKLRELSLSFSYYLEYPARNVLTASVAAAWHVLQLRSLKLHNVEVSDCFLQQLPGFKGLTCLSLDQVFVYHNEGEAVLQLAAALQHMTGLQCLAVSNTLPECIYELEYAFSDSDGDGDDTCAALERQESDNLSDLFHLLQRGYSGDDAVSYKCLEGSSVGTEGLQALLEAVGGLPVFADVYVHWELPAFCSFDDYCLSNAAHHQLAEVLRQALPAWLVPHCELQKDLLRICT